MRIIDCDQGSTEWLLARRGIATASRANDVLARLKPKKDEKEGAPAQARIDYAIELAFERAAGLVMDRPVTAAMARGSDLEPMAREAYEIATGAFVDRLGLVLHDELDAGASPDGLIGEDGLIEIKCPYSMERVARIWATNDVGEYVAQVQWQLWILGRAWCDVVVYDPRLADAGMDTFVKRVERDPAFIDRLEVEVPAFLADVAELTKTITARRAA